MLPTEIKDPTHRYSSPKNWDAATMGGECGDLWVRAEVSGPARLIELFSCWKPNKSELALLNEGGSVQVGLCTATQCAMSVGVVAPLPKPVYDGGSGEVG